MRVLVTGSAGMLGRQVANEYIRRGAEVYPLTRKELDITQYPSVQKKIEDIKPHLVVNCAAYTNVDGAETDTAEAFTVNGLAPRLLAVACLQHNATLAYISTDYIFNGQSQRPYLVSDIPGPINIYGASKLIGEQGIRESGCRYYIARTSWLYGPGGKNFVSTILSLAKTTDTLKVVNDQQGSPTYTPDLARGIADITSAGIHGTYHLTNSGITTWYEFAQRIIRLAGLKTNIVPCSTEQFPRPARRPENSALDPFPTAQVIGHLLPSWENAVEQYIKQYCRE